MLIASRVPKPPLSQFVELLWLYHETRSHTKERLLPQGSAELVINLDENRIRLCDRNGTGRDQTLTGSIVCGPHSQFFVIDSSRQHSVIGVHFRPGGLSPFLGFPAAELHNVHVSLEEIWGAAAARRLRQQLLEAPTECAKFDVLERALLARAAGRLARHPAVAFALRQLDRAEAKPTVAAVTEKIGLSERRLSQLFGDAVGLTPKLYSRVQRFQHVLRQVGYGPAGAGLDWTEIALSCGYYDQAHFNHDFRGFSGIHPTIYAAYRTGHANHVPLPE